jgi:catechol 2,3-dioxygenase-like lactoylglutathione lyase family enzyme
MSFMRAPFLLFAFAVLIPVAPAVAQLAPPNDTGVRMGHLHIKVADPEPQKRFWMDVLGAHAVKVPPFDVMKLPGLVVLIQKAESGGGTDGSSVGHLAFKVRDMKDILAKASAAGIKADGPFLFGPDGIKVEVVEDTALSAPVVHHHIHFFTASDTATKAWYVKTFGAKGGMRGKFEAADLPGVNLTFAKAESTTAPTKGRALDHIGFEVKELEAFTRKLQASGVKFDVEYKRVPALGLALAFLTDAWGTTIELTEGLDKW